MAREPKPHGQRLIARVHEGRERHRQRGRVYRALFAVAGGALIVFGIVLSAPGVPGPGLVLVGIGLAMLALEFQRAERLLERLVVPLDRISEGAGRAKPWQKAVAAAVVAAAAAGAIAAVLLWDVPFLPG